MINIKAKNQKLKDTFTTVYSTTSFGIPLYRGDDGIFVIDLTSIRIFTGIFTFVRILADKFLGRCRSDESDIMVRRKIDPRITPELASMKLTHVCIYARNTIGRQLLSIGEKFHQKLQLIFITLQSPYWGSILFPEYFHDVRTEQPKETLPALLFRFQSQKHSEPKRKNGYFFLVEYEKSNQFLRITIENSWKSRLEIRNIPHRVVTQLDLATGLVDIIDIAEAVHYEMDMEYQKNNNVYNETESHQPKFFHILQTAGITNAATLSFHWPAENSELFLPDCKNKTVNFLSKIMFLLIQKSIVKLLAQGNEVKMVSDKLQCYLDVSHHGRCLNVSLQERRIQLTMNYFLDRMPILKKFSDKHQNAFENTQILMIHHSTAEVLGIVKAFDKMGCFGLCVLFIKYLGTLPFNYLEAIHSLPDEKFQFYSLQENKSNQSIKGYYTFSKQYSPIYGLEKLDDILQQKKFDFVPSMELVGGYLFLRAAFRCRQRGKLLLLVEDGSYISPIINRLCLEGKTLGQVLTYFGQESIIPDADANELNILFSKWLAPFYSGSAEVTKNGHDQLKKVVDDYKSLAFPAASIAISKLKRGWEARETAENIIVSTEYVINNALGMIISQRQALVLGCRGAIGSNLMTYLSYRITEDKVCGVDIVVDKNEYTNTSHNNRSKWIERKTIAELPKKVLYNISLYRSCS